MNKAAQLFKKTSELKILCVVSILYGLPGEDNSIFQKTIDFIVNNKLNNNYYINYLFYIPIMYPGTNLWYDSDEKDRCYNWNKFFVNNENIIEEGKIIYRNPNIDMEKLKYYVDNSNKIINTNEYSDQLQYRFTSKLKKIKNIFSEGYNGINSFMDLKWFLLSVYYTLIK